MAECVVSENIHTHPEEGHWKFQGGRGISEAKVLKGKYETKLEFPEGWGIQTKETLFGRGGWSIPTQSSAMHPKTVPTCKTATIIGVCPSLLTAFRSAPADAKSLASLHDTSPMEVFSSGGRL